jgi:preprotein translocase subunit SecB
MLSPLQLEEYKILQVHFNTKMIDKDVVPLSFGHALTVQKQVETDDKWLVRLDVRFSPENDEELAAYLGEVTVVGLFTLDTDFPTENALNMVHINAGAILYGVVRELLSSISARGVHGPLLLPTLDARCFLPKSDDKQPEV